MWESVWTIVKRLRKLGVQSIKESTKKVWGAVLVHHAMKAGHPMPCYHEIYAVVCHLGQCFLTFKEAPWPGAPTLASYPLHPHDLGEATLKACYQEEQPEARFLTDLINLVQKHIPVRSTSHLLKEPPRTKTNAAQPAASPKASAADTPAATTATFLQMLQYSTTWNNGPRSWKLCWPSKLHQRHLPATLVKWCPWQHPLHLVPAQYQLHLSKPILPKIHLHLCRSQLKPA